MGFGAIALAGFLAVSAASAQTEPKAPVLSSTPWARAGARGWSVCLELEEDARAMRVEGSSPNNRNARDTWAARARQCPNVPEILVLAAEQTVVALQPATLASATRNDVEALVRAHRASLARSLGWLDTALGEANLRGQLPPPGTRYLRAVVLLGLGRLEGAELALVDAVARGDVPRWRGDRTAAVIALMRGDLDTALRSAHRSLRDAPRNDTAQIVMSRYVLALVLDRVGAPSESREQLSSLRRQYRHTHPAPAVEALLPIHERLYLRALFHQAADNETNARLLWELYLSRPEPDEPERRLARRHLNELAPERPVDGFSPEPEGADEGTDEGTPSSSPTEAAPGSVPGGTPASSVAPSLPRAGS